MEWVVHLTMYLSSVGTRAIEGWKQTEAVLWLLQQHGRWEGIGYSRGTGHRHAMFTS